MADSPWLVYGAAIVGVFLVAAGMAGVVYGGNAAVQRPLGRCGKPTIGVWPSNATKSQGGTDARPLDIQHLQYGTLSAAEQRAVRQGINDTNEKGTVDGPFPHEAAFRRGVIVDYRGHPHYATLESADTCASASPTVFPAGVVSVIAGAGLFVIAYRPSVLDRFRP